MKISCKSRNRVANAGSDESFVLIGIDGVFSLFFGDYVVSIPEFLMRDTYLSRRTYCCPLRQDKPGADAMVTRMILKIIHPGSRERVCRKPTGIETRGKKGRLRGDVTMVRTKTGEQYQ